ncbi:MAG: flagellar M-ring protein FliF [Deltaproteobacteria bacterium]|nr:flagellar M-ring protein FliF [Deltaproteobacteria bacterium]MCB9787791.1 flagellar M-ring protein FliF [Deltaproteobacteria bacterium]
MADDEQPEEQSVLARYRGVYESLPAPRRRLIAAVAAAALLGLGYIAFRGATEPGWRPVAHGMDPTEQQAAVAALEARSIPYRLADAGTILVPEDRIYDARLEIATSAMPSGKTVGFELFDESELGRSTFAERVNYHRALEGELARTIQTLEQVQRARVHLVLPERVLFEEDQSLPSASVVVDLVPGSELERRQVEAIRQLVASGVERLTAGNVSVVDQSGTMLAGPDSDDGLSEDALVYRRRLEEGLERRIVALLEPVIGRGRVRAQVAADVDFSRLVETEEKFDPESQVIRSERERTETVREVDRPEVGPPGTASNLPDRPAANTNAAPVEAARSEKLDHIKNYEVDRATTRRESPQARVQRLSIAVLVDSSAGEQAPTDAQIEAWKTLVSRAAGLDTARGDAVEVVAERFAQPLAAETAPAEGSAAGLSLDSISPVWLIIGAVVLLLILVTAFLLWRRARRRRVDERDEARRQELEEARRALAHMPEAEPEVREMQQIIAALRRRAQEHTEEDVRRTAAIIRRWIREGTEKEEAA